MIFSHRGSVCRNSHFSGRSHCLSQTCIASTLSHPGIRSCCSRSPRSIGLKADLQSSCSGLQKLIRELWSPRKPSKNRNPVSQEQGQPFPEFSNPLILAPYLQQAWEYHCFHLHPSSSFEGSLASGILQWVCLRINWSSFGMLPADFNCVPWLICNFL